MMRGQRAVLVHILRSEGVFGVVRRLVFTYSRVHSFAAMRLWLDGRLAEPEVPEGFELREVSIAEVAELRRTRTDLPEYFFRDTAEPLERVWVGIKDGVFGFICWVSYRGSSGMIRLRKGDAELAYIYSMPDFRGRRLTTQAVLMVAHALRAEGFTQLWAVPNTLNPAIVKSFEGCGLQHVFRIRKYGPIKWPKTPVPLDSYQ